jgi:hypothetical protein
MLSLIPKIERFAGGNGLAATVAMHPTGTAGTRPPVVGIFVSTSGVPQRLQGEVWGNAPIQSRPWSVGFLRDARTFPEAS